MLLPENRCHTVSSWLLPIRHGKPWVGPQDLLLFFSTKFFDVTKRLPFLWFIFFIGMMGSNTCLYAISKKVFVDSLNPPPGFSLSDANQHIRVSVSLLGQPIGFYYVDIHQGRLSFYSLKRLVSQLSGVRKKKLAQALAHQSLPLNIECASNGMATLPNSCEQLKKELIYIIYNPYDETVQLFLSSTYFQPSNVDERINFIPNSTASWSYINKLGAAGSFSNEVPLSSLLNIYNTTPNYYNIYSNNIFAYKNSSIIGNLSQNNGINNGQHFQVQSVYAQTIAQDKIYTGGYINNPTSPFFQTQIIAGASLRTTLDTVKNADYITASPLVIFVPQASQVSIFRNEQLIFSNYLTAGYQSINTRGFPDGGYELTIKIGSNNTLRRFFTKGFLLPPVNAPQFYIIGGYLTNELTITNNTFNFLPKTRNIPVLQTGLNKRLSQRLALAMDMLLKNNQALFNIGPTFFLNNSLIKTQTLMTTKGNYGVYTLLNTQRNRLNFNLIITKIFYHNKNSDYYFLDDLIDNDSLSVSYRLFDNDFLGIQANYSKNLIQPSTYSYGAFYQKQIAQFHGVGLFFNAAYNQASYVGGSYYVGLSLNFSHHTLAGSELLSWQPQRHRPSHDQLAMPIVIQGNTVYSHDNEDMPGTGFAVNEIHSLSPTVTSLAGIYNQTASKRFVSTYANYNQIDNKRPSIGYGGSLETEMVFNANGFNLNGVERGNTAGINIAVSSTNVDDTSAQFVLLDSHNRHIATLPVNKRTFVSLPAFTDQDYTLNNRSNSEYFIDHPTQHITLYPGNIDYHTWIVDKRIIVIGRLVTTTFHRPLINTWIHNANNGIFSDSEGYFQLELAKNTKVLTVDLSEPCHIHLPALGNDYLYIGEVSC